MFCVLTCLLKWHFYSPKQMFYDVNLLWCWWKFQYLFNGTLYNKKDLTFPMIISICVASPKGSQGKCRWQICAMIICNCGAKSQMFFPNKLRPCKCRFRHRKRILRIIESLQMSIFRKWANKILLLKFLNFIAYFKLRKFISISICCNDIHQNGSKTNRT